MANERSLAVGVSFLGYGDPGDGVPASIYTQCPIVHEGSVAFNFNEATSVDFRAEGMKDPWESFDKAGDPDSFEFAIPSPTAQEMLAFCGGSVSGGKWNAPIDIPNIRKSFKIQTTPYKGKYTEYTFAICKVSTRLSQAQSSEQTDLLLVKCTRLAAITSAGQQRSSFGRAVMNVTLTPVTAVAITGTPRVGETLMATLTPAEATGDFQWQRKVDGQGEAQDIEGAIGDSYMIQPENEGDKILVKFMANGLYSGEKTSAETEAVQAAE